MNAIWIAIASISVLGLVFGVILGYASRRFAVEDDPLLKKLMSFCRKASVGSAAIRLPPLCRSGRCAG
jgi:electron transport complex protein RnfB